MMRLFSVGLILSMGLYLSSCAVFKSSPSPSKTSASKRPLLVKPKGVYANYVRDIVRTARTYTGTPYRSGGNDRKGIDCSGLICNVYSEVGLKVPRISWQQAEFGTEIEEVKDIKAGDWIFYVPDAGKAGYVSHVGIVTEVRNINEVIFIHASSSKGVREDNLYSKYFKNRFVKAMRPF
ncbi:MAG: C40 family peptidase [Spirosomataceae bacterium]